MLMWAGAVTTRWIVVTVTLDSVGMHYTLHNTIDSGCPAARLANRFRGQGKQCQVGDTKSPYPVLGIREKGTETMVRLWR